jgi:hypothetical protein
MEKTVYQYIYDQVGKFLSEHGFKAETDGVDYFSDGTRAVCIEYDDAAGLLKLKSAQLEEGQSVVWHEMSSWLFSDKSDDRDKKSIANDYIDTLSKMLDVKNSSAGNVALPTKVAKGSTMNVDSFTARFLDIYASLKPIYKETVAESGEFMYDTFYKNHGVPAVKSTLTAGTKKQITKCFAFLDEAFIDGDNNVKSIVIYILMLGVFLDNAELREEMEHYLEKHKYLKSSTDSMLKIMASEKNRKKYLVG